MHRAGLALFALTLGCGHLPSPLAPNVTGGIGMTHKGFLVAGVSVPSDAKGISLLREDGHHWGTGRFVAAIERAAAAVDDQRPGNVLTIGDLSAKNGGQLAPHFSHRAGRDADLLFYMTTLEGAPLGKHEFLHVGTDGIAFDEKTQRFTRLDVEREWLLVKSLLEDPEARIQWIFVNDNVKAILMEWALARGEPTDTVWRAQQVMLEPHPGGPHDDHVHVRTACTQEEIDSGCEPFGPVRSWLTLAPRPAADSTDELARWLLRPLKQETASLL